MSFLETFLAVFPMAFLLSVGHCIGMCGGFVIAYSAKLAKKSKKESFFYSLSYHLARVFAYACLGVLAGYFGSIFAISVKFMGYFKFIIGIFLIVLGVAFLKRGEILRIIENDKIWQKFIAKPTKFAMQKSSLSAFILLGFLNGLLPCGIVYAFLAMAMLSGSVLKGVLIMILFGLATMPTLLGLSFISNLLSLKFRERAFNVSAIIIILFGIYSSYLGFIATT